MQVKRSVKVDGRTIGTVAVEILDTLPAPAATINYRITSVVGGVIGCIRCTGYETMRRLVAAIIRGMRHDEKDTDDHEEA